MYIGLLVPEVLCKKVREVEKVTHSTSPTAHIMVDHHNLSLRSGHGSDITNSLMKKMFKGAIVVICAIMVLDFGSALMWAASGQIPTDEFYFGTITTHVIRSIAQ